jgi:RimJ/RimL family protein N-acetyltransferase
MTTLKTERLILRQINIADAEAKFRIWADNPEVYHFLPPYYRDDSNTANLWIDESFHDFRKAKPDSWELFALVLKSTNETIGSIELTEIDHDVRSAETGYHLCKKWWGNGYAAEALRELLDYSFTVKNLNRVWATYDTRNPNSGKVMQKAGMLYEGTFRQCKIRNGVLVDRVYYAMLKEDWEALT